MLRKANFLTSQKTYIFLISGLLLSIPLPYGFSTALLIALLLVSLLSLLKHKPAWNTAYMLPLGFYLLMIVSLFWTINSKDSFRGLERQLALVIIPLAFIFMPVITKDSRNKILKYFSLGMVAFAVFFIGAALARFFNTDDTSVFFYHALVAPLELNAIYVSVLTSLGLIYLLFVEQRSIVNIVALIVLAVFLLLLSSKTIIVTTFVVAVFGLFSTLRKKTIVIASIAFLALLAAFVVIPNPVSGRFYREINVSNIDEVLSKEKFNKVYDWTGTTIRLFQARICYEMLDQDDAFVTGYGINTSQSKIIEKQKEYNLWQGYYTYNFHNQYLQAFAELGVFGLLFIVLLLLALFRQYLTTKEIFVFAVFFIMLAVFMTESYLWRQRGLYHFVLLYCLLFKTGQRKPIENQIDKFN